MQKLDYINIDMQKFLICYEKFSIFFLFTQEHFTHYGYFFH